ncbi:MAG TPA: hypothetical protein VNJ08_15025 [Bacteriovoracaceae bacterium]|nr:hypothetical protein [Bacteriovoracaceae bacterium]
MRKPAIIVDLDGTLADIRVRLKHLENGKKDWKKFHATIETDDLHEWCREIVNRMAKDHMIIIVSGRIDTLKVQTEEWLNQHDVKWDHLFMRPHDDHRPDQVLKLEIFETYIKPEFKVLFVLDDRTKVVNMWRDQGLVCLQCAPGDF